MKNIPVRSVQDDLDFIKLVLDGSIKPSRSFLLAPRIAVEASVAGYAVAIMGGGAAPIGLPKGQPAIKEVKAVAASAGKAAIAGVAGQVAIKDSHEYYYSLYDSGRQIIVAKFTDLTLEYYGHSCPYCGVDTVTHIDHFLPRSIFPELSISLQNLIMSCDECNSVHKRELWGNGINQIFFHPAINTLPTVNFLVATCVYAAQSITTSFSIAPGSPALIQRHFDEMNLNMRYIAKATLEETPKMRNIMAPNPTTAKKISELNIFVTQQMLANGVNTWQRAFYFAIQPLVPQIAAGGL